MRRSLSDVAPVLTVNDLAHYLKVHPSTVYRLIKARQLPAFKVGRDWRFNVEEIDRWRLEGEKKPNPHKVANSRQSAAPNASE